MHSAPTDLEFRLIHIPSSLDSPRAADLIEMVRVRNLVYLEISGHDDERITAEELLPALRRTEYEIRYVWLVLLGGAAIGRVGVDIPLEADSKVAFWRIELLRESWGQGVGAAGHALVERTAREHGRTVLQSWAAHPDAPGPRLSPPTGFGSIPDDHAARFYRHHGYSLEQVERNSALDLVEAGPRLQRLHAQAVAASAAYRVVHWFLPTPPEFVAGYGWMKSRMITDAPAAAMEFDEEEWDAARLARHEAIYLLAGRPMHVTAAQHIQSGALCAFTELVIGNDRTEATHQEDTLVLAEHRGHKLGLLVKCAALLSWREFAPESARVLTYNAEENRPMLDINEAMGFVPIAYEGAWKKVLDA